MTGRGKLEFECLHKVFSIIGKNLPRWTVLDDDR